MMSMSRSLATVDVEQAGGAAVARLCGEIDLSNAGAVEDRLRSATDGRGTLVLDLTRLDYMDSAGVALLHRLARTGLDEGRDIAVVVAEGSFARRILEITRLDAVVPLASTIEDALAVVT